MRNILYSKQVMKLSKQTTHKIGEKVVKKRTLEMV